jgi:hypothetical protein
MYSDFVYSNFGLYFQKVQTETAYGKSLVSLGVAKGLRDAKRQAVFKIRTATTCAPICYHMRGDPFLVRKLIPIWNQQLIQHFDKSNTLSVGNSTDHHWLLTGITTGRPGIYHPLRRPVFQRAIFRSPDGTGLPR